MANEGGAKAGKAGGAGKEKRQEKKAKRAGKEKKKNPVLQEARTRYSDELKKQGVSGDQAKAKMKTHLKDVVKPAMTEAREGAKSKNLKGPERKKFIQDAVRSKLGMQA
ncbi:MAG: hypothetical protein JO056_13100 [Alphaproteobacteria bacterium]|jgi:hypothetical protein|nr:hypothetical protein [Alphaproteobacteria bacterium]